MKYGNLFDLSERNFINYGLPEIKSYETPYGSHFKIKQNPEYRELYEKLLNKDVIEKENKMKTYDFTKWMSDFDKLIEELGQNLNHTIKTNEENVVITIKQPGMNKENTEININDNIMKVSVNLNPGKKNASFRLSEKLNLKKIDAECKDGILKITIEMKKINKIKIDIK